MSTAQCVYDLYVCSSTLTATEEENIFTSTHTLTHIEHCSLIQRNTHIHQAQRDINIYTHTYIKLSLSRIASGYNMGGGGGLEK